MSDFGAVAVGPVLRFGWRDRAAGTFWEVDIAPEPQTGQHCSMKHPESQFVVEVTADDEIACLAPKQAAQRIKMTDVASIHVETKDGGPWGGGSSIIRRRSFSVEK